MFLDTLNRERVERLKDRVHQVNRDIDTRGVRRPGVSARADGVPVGLNADLMTGYSYGEFYDWDLYFENLYLSHFGVATYCRTNTEAFLDRQLSSGFIARTIISPRMRQHFKPFLAQTALLGAKQFGSFIWLKDKYYERLSKYIDYWRWFCDFDRNGLSVWDSADHSGMDNQVLRAGELDTMTVEGVDLNCYIVRELDAMAAIAENLDLAADADQWGSHASSLRQLINDILYDEESGFYYDRDERTGEMKKVLSASSFAPLWAGVCDDRQAEALILRHLLNPDEFWLEYPLASWAKGTEGYYQQRKGGECTWMGACWVPINYMAMHGMKRYGYKEEAALLAKKTFEMALNEDRTREYYDAETGAGQGLNPFWGWSALAYAMPFEMEADYDPTDANTPIRPLLSEILQIAY